MEGGSAVGKAATQIANDIPTGALAVVKGMDEVVLHASYAVNKVMSSAKIGLKAGNIIEGVNAAVTVINSRIVTNQVGRTMSTIDNTRVNHNYGAKNGNIEVAAFNSRQAFDITDKVRENVEVFSEIVGNDKLAKHLKIGGKIYFVGSVADNMVNKNIGGLLENGADLIFKNNAYYFFYKNVIKSDFANNEALTDLAIQYLNAKNYAIQASDKLNEARHNGNQDDINDWSDELKLRNEAAVEKEKEFFQMIKYLRKEIPQEPYLPAEVRKQDW